MSPHEQGSPPGKATTPKLAPATNENRPQPTRNGPPTWRAKVADLSYEDTLVWARDRCERPPTRDEYEQAQGRPAPRFERNAPEPEYLAVERVEALDALTVEPNSRPIVHGFVPVSSIKSERIAWLWSNYIPLGDVTLFAGMEKAGKSLLCCNLAAQVSTGTLDGDLYGLPARALYLTREDRIGAVVKPRLVLAGADLDLVMVEAVDDDRPVTPDRIAAACAEGVRLVILDPLTLFLDGLDDERSDLRVRASLAPVVRLAQEQRTAVIGIKHMNKGEGRAALNRVSGSRAYTAAVRSILMVTDDPEHDGGHLLFAQGNLAESSSGLGYTIDGRPVDLDDGTNQNHPAIGWREASSSVTLASALAHTDRPDGDGGEGATPRDAARLFLLEVLSSGEVEGRDVKLMARESDIAKNTLQRAAKSLGVEYRNEGFGKEFRTWWGLPRNDDSTPTPSTQSHLENVGLSVESGVECDDGSTTQPQLMQSTPTLDDGVECGPSGVECNEDDKTPRVEQRWSERLADDLVAYVDLPAQGAQSPDGEHVERLDVSGREGRTCPRCGTSAPNLYGIEEPRVCLSCFHQDQATRS